MQVVVRRGLEPPSRRHRWGPQTTSCTHIGRKRSHGDRYPDRPISRSAEAAADRSAASAWSRYPDVLLADARKVATQHCGRIFDGADPAEEKESESRTHRDTIGVLFDLYKTHRQHAKSWTETRRIMEREVLPAWRHTCVADLRRRYLRELVERKAQFEPVIANRIVSRFSAIPTFSMKHDWIETNPAWRIRPPG